MQGRERCLKPSLQREHASPVRKLHRNFSWRKVISYKIIKKNLFVVDENELAVKGARLTYSNPVKTPQPLYL
jgi:hypothetical protein